MKVEQYVMAYGVEQDRVRAILPEGFESLRPVLRINAEIRDDKIGYLEFNAPAEKDGKRGWINIGNWDNVKFEKIKTQKSDSTKFDKRALQIGDVEDGVDNCDARGGTEADVNAVEASDDDAARISTVFRLDNLEITFTRVGVQGACPAEKDNQGCFFKVRSNEATGKDHLAGIDDLQEIEDVISNEREIDKRNSWVFRPAEVITSNKEFCDCEFKWDFEGQGAQGKSVGETIPAFLEEVTNHYPKKEFTARNAAVIPCVNEKVLGAYVVEFER